MTALNMHQNMSSGFIANVGKLVSGNAFAQALGILVLPVLTRFFSPDAFGVAALFTSFTGVLGVIACLRYELAIMLPETDEEAANILGVCIVAVITVCILIAIIIGFADEAIVSLLNAPELKPYLWLIPVSVFFSGIFLGLSYWNARAKRFGRLSIAQVLSSVGSQTTKLVAGFVGFLSAGALIGASILGVAVSASVLGGSTWRHDNRVFSSNIRWSRMIRGLKQYRKFPLFGTWSILLNTMSQQLPVWILSIYFSATEVGYYSLGRIILGAPIVLIGGAVSQVFYQKAVEVKDNRRDLPLAVDVVFSRLVSLGIFPLLLLTLIGGDLFSVVFGTQWVEAGVYAQILALWIFFQFISAPLSTVFSVLERQGSMLIFNIILFISRLVSLLLGGMTGDIYLTLILFAGTGVACYVFLCCWIIMLSGLPISRGIAVLCKYGLSSMFLLLSIPLIKWWWDLTSIWILLIGLVLSMVYYIWVINQDAELRKMSHMVMHRVGLVK